MEMTMSFVGLIFIVTVVGLVVALLLRVWTPRSVFRGPRRRHVVTRIVCGALGVGIIVAICAEAYLFQDHSIMLAMGGGLRDFIEHVDSLIVRASDSPI